MAELTKEQEQYAADLASDYPTVRARAFGTLGLAKITPGECAEDGETFTALDATHVIDANGKPVRFEATA